METNKNTTNSSIGSGQEKESLTQQATQQAIAAKDAVKQTVAETASTVKQQTRQAVHDAQQTVGELATDAKQTATAKLGEAKERAESMVDERKNQTADRLQGIAGALRETSTKLQDQEEDAFANYAASAAEQVDKFSGYLRNQNVGDLVHDVEGFARRQPELFLAGALAAGFMLGRFFKSSAASQANQIQRYDQSSYGTTPQQSRYGAAGYGNAYATGSSQPYGSQPGQYDAGGDGQYSSSEYQDRQQGSYDSQTSRPNRGEWSTTSEISDQSTSGLASTHMGPTSTGSQNAGQNEAHRAGSQTQTPSSNPANSPSKEN